MATCQPDKSTCILVLFLQGLAREVVNRVQRLRKKAGLQATDAGALCKCYCTGCTAALTLLQEVSQCGTAGHGRRCA